MPKMLLLGAIALIICTGSYARDYTEKEARAAWNALRMKPVTEENFEQGCDLIQDIAQTNISVAYQIIGEYLPIVKKNREQALVTCPAHGLGKGQGIPD
jgi:hypothetical protein